MISRRYFNLTLIQSPYVGPWWCVFLLTDSYFIFLIQGAVVSSYTVVERTVRPGENVTLHCDCKRSPGETIVWYRNCSHENQPTRILRPWKETRENEDSHSIPLNEMKNRSSQSHTLLIMNISDSHLGLYCCGMEKKVTPDGGRIGTYEHRYGNVATRISFGKLTLHRFL